MEEEKHISRQFHKELEDIKGKLVLMGNFVLEQLDNSIDALLKTDLDRAVQVKKNDYQVNRLELLTDEECALIIAKRQPVAKDLRLIIAINRSISDLERIGDQSKRIAKITIKMNKNQEVVFSEDEEGFEEIKYIQSLVVHKMLKRVIESFNNFDTDIARSVLEYDDEVDKAYKVVVRSIIATMIEDSSKVSRCLNLIWILRSLERVGDLTCNIAENIIYLVTGSDIRYRKS